ncbi:MAG: hypothetical protein R3E01_17520 [Pirellulaceae bacterium]
MDRTGLRVFVRKTEHSPPFLTRRASRENAECLWAVLPPGHADYIQHVRRLGDPRWVLRLLEYFATDIGRIPLAAIDEDFLLEGVTFPEWRDKESLI